MQTVILIQYLVRIDQGSYFIYCQMRQKDLLEGVDFCMKHAGDILSDPQYIIQYYCVSKGKINVMRKLPISVQN